MTTRRGVALRITARVLLAVFVGSACCVAPAFAAKSRAVVIAVSKFDDSDEIQQLPYVENDAKTIVKTLKDLNFEVDAYCEKSEGVPKAKEPTRENILNGIQNMVENTGENDVVLIYVSSHGIAPEISENGRSVGRKTYLAAKDTRLADGSTGKSKERTEAELAEEIATNLDKTAIAASDLRKAASEMPTKNVFLAFDACQSAGTRGDYSLLNYLRSEDNYEVATLASCTALQRSGALDPAGGERISLFTYWLNEGLKGFADKNLDGEISTVELSEYVQANVRSACDLLFPVKKGERNEPNSYKGEEKRQTPQVIAPETAKKFALAKVEPFDSADALDGIADQIATRLKDSQSETENFSFCLDVSADLLDAPNEPARDALEGFRKSVRSELERRVAEKLKKAGRDLKIESDAQRKGESVPEFSCKIEMDDARYVLSGRLSDLKNSAGSDISDCVVKAAIGYDAETDARLGEVAEPVPGVADYSDAADVWLEVTKTDGTVETRYPTSINGALWVPLDAGERYRILYRFSQISKRGFGARVLVDGRNTLEQYESYVPPMKFVAVAEVPDESVPKDDEPEDDEPESDETESDETESDETESDETEVAAEPVETIRPRTSLDGAKFWVASRANATYSVMGFCRRTSDDNATGVANGTCQPFLVASADESTARGCGDPGSILVAFYELRKQRSPGPRDLVTVPGAEEPLSLIRVNGLEIDENQPPFACFSIRYASSSALERFRREPDAFYSGDQTFYDEAETEDFNYR